MAKKITVAGEGLSKEDQIKIIKKVLGNVPVGDSEITKLCVVEKIQTNIPTLDYLLGGGISEGKITILAGNPSSCKSTLSLQILPSLIEHTKKKYGGQKYVLWIDAESSWDSPYAKGLGIDQDYVIVDNKSNVLEEAFEKADNLISSGLISAVIVDSLDVLPARKTDDNAYQNTMGAQSGALAAHLPKLQRTMADHNVTAIFIKQARVKMGLTTPGEVITFNGGKALRHSADTILIMKRLSANNLTYTPIQIKAEKTRSARMGLTLQIPQGELGFDTTRDLVDLAIIHGMISVGGGGWINWGEKKIQGTENLLRELNKDKDFIASLKTRVYNEIINVSSIKCTATEEMIVDLDGEME